MPNTIKSRTSRIEATARGIKRKIEDETVGKLEDTTIKITKNLCSLMIENKSLKKQNDILKQKLRNRAKG